MLLHKLLITDKNTKTTIREINFNLKGVNLVTDLSEKININGNNVGKTTVLQIINICLGASINTLYSIDENKSKDENYKKYLQNNIEFKLHIGDISSVKYEINIVCAENPLYRINNTGYNTTEFRKRIQEILFNFDKKPDLSDLKRKYFRIYAETLDNIYKVLDPYSDILDYEIFYLYLFGFNSEENIEVLNNKWLYTEKKKKVGRLSPTNKEVSDLEIKSEELKNQINKLEEQKRTINLTEYQELLLQKLSKKQEEVYNNRWSIIDIENKINSNKETQELLEISESSINSADLKAIYDQANILVESISKKFEDMILFHNQMMHNKKEYLNKNLKELKKEYKTLQTNLDKLCEEEKNLLDQIEIGKEDSLLGIYDEIGKSILKFSKKKAKIDEKIESIKAYNSEISDLNKKITDCNNKINVFYPLYKKNIYSLNEYIQDIINFCNIKEELGFNIKQDSGYLSLEFSHSVKNSDGILRLHMLMFDIAYLMLSQAEGFNYPNFIIHDRLESIDNTYLNLVLQYVQEKTNIQLIASVLRSKITIDHERLKKLTILELSNINGGKLFKKDNFIE